MLDKIKSNIKDYSTEQAMKIALGLIKHTTDDQMVALLKIFEKISPTGNTKRTVRDVRVDFEKKGVWHTLLKKLAKEIHPNCREKFFKNFIINPYINSKNQKLREEYRNKYGEYPPSHLVISPTMHCNLRCIGCYAERYSKKDDLDYKTFDRIINEAKKLGIYFFTITGGEPFIRKDIFDIFKKHNDAFFHVYTNGTFLNKKTVAKIVKLGNIAPAISVEGFEKETDARRGKGVYKKVMEAMDNLHEAGVIFGFSATPTRLNTDILTQDKFIDKMIKKGAMFGWFFNYIPIGKDPDLNLMATPEQRELLRITIQKKWRDKKPIFLGDFWNDGPFVGGCMAGGSMYLHINVYGDVEPCVFAQLSVDNIKNTTLEKALQSDMFKFIRERNQSVRAKKPTSENLLTPCMIIDNPKVLRECAKTCKHRFSYPGGDHLVKNKKTMDFLDNYSKNWHKIADKAWEKEFGHQYWLEKKAVFCKKNPKK